MNPPESSRIAGAWRAVVRLLRRPAVVLAEVILFGGGAALAASLPQQPDAEGLRRLAESSPRLGRVVELLGLDEIVTSPWFLVVTLLCILSLAAVQAQQWPRLIRVLNAPADPASFARAPFRRSVPLALTRGAPDAPRFTSSGRLGLAGSPVFHAGLLLLGVAGLVRLLTFRDVVGRAFEGDRFAASPGAFEAERGGRLSRPFVLPQPVRVKEIREDRYDSGALRQVEATLELESSHGRAAQVRQAAINAPLDLEDVRLYVATAHGVAALFQRTGPSGPEYLTGWLEERGGEWRGGVRSGGGLELRLRAGARVRPGVVEVRALYDGVLLRVAEVSPGATMQLRGGEALELVGLPYWVQLRGSRDPSKPLFFAGVIVGILGIVLMFSLNKVDSAVFVEGDQLVVALRPQRFAPLYAERFERLCKEWLS
jgi:hypothetical protein